MKKSILILLVIALILSFATPATAAGTSGVKSDYIATPDGTTFTQDDVYNTTVEYTVSSESYTIVIPSQTIFSKKGEVLPSWVNVTSITLTYGHNLSVHLNSTHDFQMVTHTGGVSDGQSVLNYNMTYVSLDGDHIVLDNDNYNGPQHEMFRVIAGQIPQDGVHIPIKFEMTDVAPTTGHYKDTLTFTVKFNIPEQQSP